MPFFELIGKLTRINDPKEILALFPDLPPEEPEVDKISLDTFIGIKQWIIMRALLVEDLIDFDLLIKVARNACSE